MPIVKAGPEQYLLTSRRGTLENRGSAVRAILPPGAIWVLVPSGKQEATFEFTQETRDGIPLRFKGIVIYRITDPVAAARQFDFSGRHGEQDVSTLLTHVCLGELRDAVSHMTMAECIEERKTRLSRIVADALREATQGTDGSGHDWGVTIEVAQLAQVFIVDTELRQQLEAEVRDEIRLRSDQSGVRTREETRLTEMASEDRVRERSLERDMEDLRRQEALETATVARERRQQAEALETERQALAIERERVEAEVPVRRLRMEAERDLLRDELELRRLRNAANALQVEHDLELPRARQALRREILPLEQAPRIAEAASKVLQGTRLSLYGEDGGLSKQLTPILDVLAGTLRDVLQPTDGGTRAGGDERPLP